LGRNCNLGSNGLIRPQWCLYLNTSQKSSASNLAMSYMIFRSERLREFNFDGNSKKATFKEKFYNLVSLMRRLGLEAINSKVSSFHIASDKFGG